MGWSADVVGRWCSDSSSCSMQTRPRTGARRPVTATSSALLPWRGARRHRPNQHGGPSLLPPHPDVCPLRAPSATSLWRAPAALDTVIAGGGGGSAGAGWRPSTRSGAPGRAGRRPADRGRRVGGGPRPAASGDPQRVAEPILLEVIGGVLGLVAAAGSGSDAVTRRTRAASWCAPPRRRARVKPRASAEVPRRRVMAL